VSRLRVPVLVVAWLVPLGVLGQAVVAGQALFSDPQLFGLHGGLGHGVLALALLTATLAWVGRVGRATALAATLSVLLLIGQTGLGYAGRRSGIALASSLHVPLGTTLLAVTTVVAVLLTQHLRTGTR
jgi:hypothetical protein